MSLKVLAFLVALLVPISAEQFAPFDQARLSNESFLEQFQYASLKESGWIPSKSYKSGQADYTGKWKLANNSKYAAFENEKGLLMMKEAAYYAISKKLPNTYVRGDKDDLVVQFEVKFQEGVSCTGGYIKLLSEGTIEDEFSDRTPFEVMFGPDICGSESKVHFIIKKRDAETGEIIEHRIKKPPMARNHVLTNLYTLVFRSDGSTEIRLNGEVIKAGNPLKTAKFMDPPLTEPEFIEDKDAKKPEDWDDRFFIDDPNAVKPDDWDEVYGRPWIPDPSIEKPEGWNDDETIPSEIPNPKASKPKEWIDELDGEWEVPMIPNPECLHGCGKWDPPQIPNPKYKGIWVPPQIENPNYLGVWRVPKIKNPRYGQDDNTHLIGPVDALGFELWSMTQGVLFTNIYLGKSISEAERIGNETFVPKTELEWKNYHATKPKPKHDAKPPPPTFEDYLEDDTESIFDEGMELIRQFYKGLYDDALDYWHSFQNDPALAISENPVFFIIFCVIGLVGFVVCFAAINVVLFLLLRAKGEPTRKAQPVSKEQSELRSESDLLRNNGVSAKGTLATDNLDDLEPNATATGTGLLERGELRKREGKKGE